jgi:hypothetical protein
MKTISAFVFAAWGALGIKPRVRMADGLTGSANNPPVTILSVGSPSPILDIAIRKAVP